MGITLSRAATDYAGMAADIAAALGHQGESLDLETHLELNPGLIRAVGTGGRVEVDLTEKALQKLFPDVSPIALASVFDGLLTPTHGGALRTGVLPHSVPPPPDLEQNVFDPPSAPRSQAVVGPRLEEAPPARLSSIFPSTTDEARRTYEGKRIVVVTNVYADGIGDAGMAASLVKQLVEAGAKVEHIVCAVKGKEDDVMRALPETGARVSLKVGLPTDPEITNSPIITADIDLGKDTTVRKMMKSADLVITFPTRVKLPPELGKKLVQVEECVRTGPNVLGFGIDKMAGQPRLGAILGNLGEITDNNLKHVRSGALAAAICGSEDLATFRQNNVFSVGYVKMPEGKASIATIHAKRGVVKNTYMDNYLRLMSTSAPLDKGVVLYCPNFDPKASNLKTDPPGPTGALTTYKVNVDGREIRVVAGMSDQPDMHRLFNEAAVNGELHRRPIFVGAGGEGTFSEVLSIRAPNQPVVPIYSPRYDYQEANFTAFAELAPEQQRKDVKGLFSAIANLHTLKPTQIAAVAQGAVTLGDAIGRAVVTAQRDCNMMNTLAERLRTSYGVRPQAPSQLSARPESSSSGRPPLEKKGQGVDKKDGTD